MPVKSVDIQVVFTMTRDYASMLHHQGKLDAVRAERAAEVGEAEEELNALLNAGYVIVASHPVTVDSGVMIHYTLWLAEEGGGDNG